MNEHHSPIADASVNAVLNRLHALADKQDRSLILKFLDQIPRLVRGRPIDWSVVGSRLDDAFICLNRDQGAFCYLLARALDARTIVEFGTSLGVSTIYLAAAVRDNGGGRVIGTERVAAKAARARAHLAEAGLSDFVQIREGDALRTLCTLDSGVDMFLNDGFPEAALPVLEIVQPRLRPGGVVVADNVGAFWADHRAYLAYVRNPANGFSSSMLALNEGTELSVVCGP